MTTRQQIIENIEEKLMFFYSQQKIPNIIFHGSINSPKEIIVSSFLNKIYKGANNSIKYNILFVNCSGKGIKFIRDEIKLFSKLHITAAAEAAAAAATTNNSQNAVLFKTVILLNADLLTEDAQSALRRSIELFSFNTRFFLIVENKHKLLKPILSRFCEIYVPQPTIETEKTTKETAEINEILTFGTNGGTNGGAVFDTNGGAVFDTKGAVFDTKTIISISNKLYDEGYSTFDFINYVNEYETDLEKKAMTTFYFYSIKKEYRNEKLLLFTIIDFYFFRLYEDIKNMTFI